jgi:hypothetical protein
MRRTPREVPHITGNCEPLRSELQSDRINNAKAEAPMKKFSILLITALVLTLAISAPDASARTKVDCGSFFPIMLGVGY